MFLYIAPIAPPSQESGNTPELKIKLKKVTHYGIISCAFVLIYSFIYLFTYLFIYTIFQEGDIFSSTASLPYGPLNI